MMTESAPRGGDRPAWHPVACSAEMRAGDNIVAGFAMGIELAIWRSADGAAQVWENRCPHRSVRLTLGQVVGNRLSCAYHGWQYAAGGGQCVGIPAHPAMPAPRSVCAKVYPAAEASGMIWVDLDPRGSAEAGKASDGPLPGAGAENQTSLPGDSAQNDVRPPDAAVPAGWSFCRTLALHADIAEMRKALAQRGFVAGAGSAWRGSLADVPVVALLLDARPGLTFAHLWSEAPAGSPALHAVQRAARSLRRAIETPAG